MHSYMCIKETYITTRFRRERAAFRTDGQTHMPMLLTLSFRTADCSGGDSPMSLVLEERRSRTQSRINSSSHGRNPLHGFSAERVRVRVCVCVCSYVSPVRAGVPHFAANRGRVRYNSARPRVDRYNTASCAVHSPGRTNERSGCAITRLNSRGSGSPEGQLTEGGLRSVLL